MSEEKEKTTVSVIRRNKSTRAERIELLERILEKDRAKDAGAAHCEGPADGGTDVSPSGHDGGADGSL